MEEIRNIIEKRYQEVINNSAWKPGVYEDENGEWKIDYDLDKYENRIYQTSDGRIYSYASVKILPMLKSYRVFNSDDEYVGDYKTAKEAALKAWGTPEEFGYKLINER